MFLNIINFLKLCVGWRLFCFVISLVLTIVVLYQAILTVFFTIKLNAFILLIEYVALLCSTGYTIFGY
ncbi:MAG: hypothetical protein Q4G04_00770 [bacterium]|nr:hypothetical protein [bacterium]